MGPLEDEVEGRAVVAEVACDDDLVGRWDGLPSGAFLEIACRRRAPRSIGRIRGVHLG